MTLVLCKTLREVVFLMGAPPHQHCLRLKRLPIIDVKVSAWYCQTSYVEAGP